MVVSFKAHIQNVHYWENHYSNVQKKKKVHAQNHALHQAFRYIIVCQFERCDPYNNQRSGKIYLFGTMITGLLLIGLGFALGYRRIKETGTAVQSLTRLPVMIEAVGRAVSIETETINRNMDSIMEKRTALQRKIDGDQNGQ